MKKLLIEHHLIAENCLLLEASFLIKRKKAERSKFFLQDEG